MVPQSSLIYRLHLMPAFPASNSSREGSGSGSSQISSSACLPCTAPGLCLILRQALHGIYCRLISAGIR